MTAREPLTEGDGQGVLQSAHLEPTASRDEQIRGGGRQLRAPHSRLTIGDDSPSAGGDRNGLGKGRPETPFAKGKA